MRIIEIPPPFADLAEWKEFLAEIEAIIASEGSDAELKSAKKEAKKAIKKLGG